LVFIIIIIIIIFFQHRSCGQNLAEVSYSCRVHVNIRLSLFYRFKAWNPATLSDDVHTKFHENPWIDLKFITGDIHSNVIP